MLKEMKTKEFKVVEVCLNEGIVITHYLNGTLAENRKKIKQFKENSERYEMFGNEGMVVWAQSFTIFFSRKKQIPL